MGISVSEKLPKQRRLPLGVSRSERSPLEPRMLLDNKDKATVAESDIDKVVRDAKERSLPSPS